MAEGGSPIASSSFSEGEQSTRSLSDMPNPPTGTDEEGVHHLHSQSTTESSICQPSSGNTYEPTGADEKGDHQIHAQETSQSCVPNQEPFSYFVRDPGAPGGNRRASEVYRQRLLEYYPNYKAQVYRVPPLHISASTYRTEPDFDQIRGSEAENLVGNCIENLLNYWVEEKEKSPAFIITSYEFLNFCNKGEEEPQTDYNKSKKRGEHDVVIIHKKCGVIYVQIKSCEATTKPQVVKATVEKAFTQLDKDKEFFEDNFKDIRVDITDVLALPDSYKNELPDGVKTKITGRYGEDGLDKCLFSDNLPRNDDDNDLIETKKTRLLNWWKRITDRKNGFVSIEDYEKTVAMYVGSKSTVKGRTMSECLARISPPIVLTPLQLYVLNKDMKKLVIRGNYGAGKSVLLVLKVRQLLDAKVTPICVLSMSPAPLERVLKESIECDNGCGTGDIKYITVLDQESLKRELEIFSREKRHVFIDEFPSYFNVKPEVDLKTAIQNFPKDVYFWCIMSRERYEEMSKAIRDLFEGSDHEEVVLKTILRCPPSLHHLVPEFGGSKEERTIFEHSHGSFTKDEKNILKDHFKSLGRFKDITVVADLPTSQFFDTLSKWNIPMLRSSDVVNCSKNQIKMRRDALFDYGTPDNHENEHFRKAAVIKNSSWSMFLKEQKNDGRDIDRKDWKKESAKFLHIHGFSNESIVKEIHMAVPDGIPPRQWSDIVFVDKNDKPIVFQMLESLGIHLVTPSSDDLIGSDEVLFTDSKKSEGFDRKHTITFEGTKVIANKRRPKSTEGPSVKHIDHSEHRSSLKDCGECGKELEDHLQKIGFPLIPLRDSASGGGSLDSQKATGVQPTDSKGKSQNPIAQGEYPNMKLVLEDDLVILDDRVGEENAADLFRRIGVPVQDRFDSGSLKDEDAFGTVIYTKSRLWKGMERKVVVSIYNNKSKGGIRNFGETRQKVLEDGIEVAITRCSSQLICIKTNVAMY